MERGDHCHRQYQLCQWFRRLIWHFRFYSVPIVLGSVSREILNFFPPQFSPVFDVFVPTTSFVFSFLSYTVFSYYPSPMGKLAATEFWLLSPFHAPKMQSWPPSKLSHGQLLLKGGGDARDHIVYTQFGDCVLNEMVPIFLIIIFIGFQICVSQRVF